MKRIFTGILAIALAGPALADPVLGVGVSLSFGGAHGVQSGIGARVFSDDTEGDTVAALGVDWLIQSRTWRPTLGAAWLGENSYIGADIGFGLGGGGVDFGLSGGAVGTEEVGVGCTGGGCTPGEV